MDTTSVLVLASPSWLTDEDEDPPPSKGSASKSARGCGAAEVAPGIPPGRGAARSATTVRLSAGVSLCWDTPTHEICWNEHWGSVELDPAVALHDDDGVPVVLGLVVACPEVTLEQLRQWRRCAPRTPLLVTVVPNEQESKMQGLLGDEGIYFLREPIDRDALHQGICEVLTFLRASQQLAGEGLLPSFREQRPVDGWFELSAPSHPVFLRRFRVWLETLRVLPLADKERRQLIHAVREVGWNAIEWGNQFDPSRRIRFAVLSLDSGIHFRVENEGPERDWFPSREGADDVAALQEQRLQQGLRPGGLGLTLVERIVDSIQVSSKGNIVLLQKRFAPVGSS